MRGGDENAIRRDLGGTVEIHFYVQGAVPGVRYQVRVSSDQGSTVYTNDNFASFAATGSGEIVLPVSVFHTGFYELTVRVADDSASASMQVYNFRVD
jgi:hypothetical protein